MKSKTRWDKLNCTLAFGATAVAMTLVGVTLVASGTPAHSAVAAEPLRQAPVARFAQVPLGFEWNAGQAPADAQFVARGLAANLLLAPDRTEFQMLAQPSSLPQDLDLPQGRFALEARAAQPNRRVATTQVHPTSLTVKLVGANRFARMQGEAPLPGQVNYFIGSDPALWRSHVTTFAQVRAAQVYPGVDLVYYGSQGELEYDFRVAPGADPQQIGFAFEGATHMELDHQGDLVIDTAAGQIRHHRPQVYQESAGERHRVLAAYVLDPATHVVRFQVAPYDHTQPLVIDPVITFSTFLGGSGDDQAFGVAVDKAGFIYVAGQTSSPDFRTTKAVQAKHGGAYDVFVAKFDPTGSTLLYSTFLGGSAVDRGFHIAVDDQGEAYVVGVTFSRDFPVTKNAFQSAFGGGDRDGFMTKLSADGSILVFSTYVGGSGSDELACVAVDREGNAYSGGDSSSTNFPTLNAFQKNNRGSFDAVAVKFASNGALKYATYLGGTGPYDCAIGIAVDTDGSACLGGYTSSRDFPTAKPLQATLKGGYDAFVAKLDPAGNALAYSSFLGGSGDDVCRSVAVDKDHNIYVSGDTFSADFPLKNPLQKANAGRRDVFVTKLTPTGAELVYSTYLGGSGEELAGLAVDGAGNVCLVGLTTSTNFPIVKAFQGRPGGGTWDAFVAKLNPSGSQLLFSSYLGGNSNDQGAAVAVNKAGDLIVVGATASSDFPTMRPLQETMAGGSYDAFVVRLAEPVVIPNTLPITYTNAQSSRVTSTTTVANVPPAQPPKTNAVPERTEVEPKTNLVAVAPATTNVTVPPTKETEPTVPTNTVAAVAPPTAIKEAPSTPPATNTNAPLTIAANTPKTTEEPQPSNTSKSDLFGKNLITNGSAEEGNSAASSYAVVPIPGWTTTNKLTVLHYGMPGGFPAKNDAGTGDHGQNFFVGGPDSPVSGASQTIDVASLSSQIDAAKVNYKLAGCLGGTSGQHDNAQLEALFKGANGDTLAKATLGPVTPADRNYRTKLLLRTTAGQVPPQTRSIEVRLSMKRVEGSYNDAFADDLSLVLQPAD